MFSPLATLKISLCITSVGTGTTTTLVIIRQANRAEHFSNKYRVLVINNRYLLKQNKICEISSE